MSDLITYEDIYKNLNKREKKIFDKFEKTLGHDYMVKVVSLGIVKGLGNDYLSDDGNSGFGQVSAHGGESQMASEKESADDL